MRVILFVLLLFLSLSSSAQHTITQRYTVNQGLISNKVNKVFIDSQNNLWLGSPAGLVKKQLNKFVQDPQSIKWKFNNIFDITQDSSKAMYVASYGQGVLFISDSQSKVYSTKNGLVSDMARSLFYYNDQIFVGTNNGVSIINTKDFSITNPGFTQSYWHPFEVSSFFQSNGKVYATTINDGVFQITDQKLIPDVDIKRIFSSFVYKDWVFLGTANGLIQLQANTLKTIATYPINNVMDYFVLADKLHVVSSGIYQNSGGIYVQSDKAFLPIADSLNVNVNSIVSVRLDKENQFLYLASKDQGLYRIDLNTPIFHQSSFQLVYTLSVKDKEHYVFHDKGFTYLSNHRPLKELSLQDFKDYQVQHDSALKHITTLENDFFPLDYNTKAQDIIFYKSMLNKDHVWVCSNIGMFELDSTGEIIGYLPIHVYQFTFFNNQLVTPVPYAGVRIFQDIYNLKYNYYHNWQDNTIPTDVVSVATSKDAVYFASALQGIFEYKQGKFTSWKATNKFDELKIRHLLVTPQNILMAITDFNDIYSFDLNQPGKQEEQLLIPHSKIKGHEPALLQHIDGVLYVGTNLGINVFYQDRQFFIDKEQGIIDNTISMGVGLDNQLYIATKKGYFILKNTVFKNRQLVNLKVKLTGITVNNSAYPLPIDSQKEPWITLGAKQNNLKLSFEIQQPSYPGKIEFKYRLKQAEPWNVVKDEKNIQLYHLNEDTYHIELLTTDLHTGSKSISTVLKLTIKPAFYKSSWFLVSCFIIVLAAGIIGFKIRVSLLTKKQNEKLQAIKEKNEQHKKQLTFEKKLADVKLQALKSQMNSHFLFNVLTSIQFYIITNNIDQALYYIEKFASLIRLTLNYSDLTKVTLAQEIDYLQKYLEIENVRMETPVKFKVKVQGDFDLNQIFINPLLLQPFMENSLLHAFNNTIENPTITLKVRKQNQRYVLTLSDNGIGFDKASNSNHISKGISIVKKRLALTKEHIGESLEIKSSKNGTTVHITL
ncbi:sensor histidine kinase [Myroides sp. LJL119]